MNYGQGRRWKHTADMTNLKNALSVSFFVFAAAAPPLPTVITVHFTRLTLNVGNKYESRCIDKTV